jgi:hypothetical protein
MRMEDTYPLHYVFILWNSDVESVKIKIHSVLFPQTDQEHLLSF